MTRKHRLSKTSIDALKRVAQGHPISKDRSAALRRAGLVGVSYEYERVEWNRTVAVLDKCHLTAEGKAYLSMIGASDGSKANKDQTANPQGGNGSSAIPANPQGSNGSGVKPATTLAKQLPLL